MLLLYRWHHKSKYCLKIHLLAITVKTVNCKEGNAYAQNYDNSCWCWRCEVFHFLNLPMHMWHIEAQANLFIYVLHIHTYIYARSSIRLSTLLYLSKAKADSWVWY